MSNARAKTVWWFGYLVVGAVVLASACLVGGLWYVWADWVPDSTRGRLPGATKAEVRALLGEPDQTDTDPDRERWHYRRPFRLAEFQLDFGEDGRAQDGGSYDR